MNNILDIGDHVFLANLATAFHRGYQACPDDKPTMIAIYPSDADKISLRLAQISERWKHGLRSQN